MMNQNISAANHTQDQRLIGKTKKIYLQKLIELGKMGININYLAEMAKFY